MKKSLLIFLMLLLLFSSCSNVSKNIISPHTNIKIEGKVTEAFYKEGWTGSENPGKKGKFRRYVINSFPYQDLSIVDVYEKDGNIIFVTQNHEGDLKFFKISGPGFQMQEALENEVFDADVYKLSGNDENLWGFKRLDDYLLIIKSTGTDIYRGNIKIGSMDGVASITCFDATKKYYIILRDSDGKSLSIYEVIEDKLNKIWEYDTDAESFDGNIQTGDLNNDGITEFYVGNASGGEKKFCLTKNGFAEDTDLPADSSDYGTYYLVDYNKDGKMDIICQEENKKPVVFIQK